MSELEEAIREHLELRRRRGSGGADADRPTWSGDDATDPGPRAGVGSGAAVAERVAATPPAPDEWASVEDELQGLLSSEERRARREAAHRRALRTRQIRRGLAPAAAAVVLVLVLGGLAAGVFGGRHHARADHRRATLPATFPFAVSPAQRRPGAADELVPFWADGEPCSIGCRAPGVVAGWPLQPFHAQHALRSGLNEQRNTSFHHGIDIQAYDGSTVYAIQPGRAHIIQATGPDSRVQVGNFIYWHIRPAVREGQAIGAYRQVVGRITPPHGHLHLSEVDGANRYLNPLRPGGRALEPYRDTDPPVLARPRFAPSGQVVLRVFDPQSFRVRTTYQTPVIAPAAVAYRVFDANGQRLGSLHWALRGSQNLDWTPETAASIYAGGSRPPGGNCFERQAVCRPNYVYLLAGGLAPALTDVFLPAGRYRLSAYAWDWAGNAAARDAFFTVRPDGTISG